MELFQVEITGFKKFKETAILKARGKILAILGPNEAGKSSLLRALHLLDVDEAYGINERSRGSDENFPIIKATYLLSPEDREAVGIKVGTWYDVTKYADGNRSWEIRPSPPDRDYSHRSKLAARISKFSKAAIAHLAETDVDLSENTKALLDRIFRHEKELSAEEKQQLAELASRWRGVPTTDSLPKIQEFINDLDTAINIEMARSKCTSAGEALWDRLPEYVFFSAQDRALKSSYQWSELSAEIPKALENLAKVAELDLPKLISIATTNPNDPEFDTLMERANIALERNFQAVWKQSKVSVVLAHREQRLLIQVYNNDRSRTDFAQRSDGLRQFVALRCFTASRDSKNFILLIDEIEQHLHYDAQADLVQMLAGQTVASKVIYTTHSLGCLPEDLGNGVRLITPNSPNSDWSTIENKFWLARDKEEAGFSPILMGMGASTMAFFPTRAAVLVEGPSDSILLPTMFREVLERTSIGIQFVHGLSENGHVSLPLLNSAGKRVCYLLDNDGGGRKLVKQLTDLGVDSNNIFLWPAVEGDAELEDFIDSTLLADAALNLAKQYFGIENLISAHKLPALGKWDFIVEICKEAGIKPFQKVPMAYAVLDLLDATPSRSAIDRRQLVSVKTLANNVMAKMGEHPA